MGCCAAEESIKPLATSETNDALADLANSAYKAKEQELTIEKKKNQSLVIGQKEPKITFTEDKDL